MLDRLKPVLTPQILASIGAVLAGVICVILAEYGDMHWIRLVGAILITPVSPTRACFAFPPGCARTV
jgi:hypothetical protein